jgi:hypothetical protein
MNRLVVIAAAALAAVACSKKDGETAAPAAAANAPEGAPSVAEPTAAKPPAGFPKMTANYRAIYSARMDGDQQQQVTIDAIGAKKFRFEMPHTNETRAAAGAKIIGIFDDAQRRAVMYVEGGDLPKIAMTLPLEQSLFQNFLNWAGADSSKLKKTGSESIAGLRCDVWESAEDSESTTTQQACITSDGIILVAGDKGAAEPEIIAIKVDKGKSPESRFAVPEGFEVVDMAPCQEAMRVAMADAQAGKQPDLAAMAKCQAIATKIGQAFGSLDE